MIREEEFRISKRPYAIDPEGLRVRPVKEGGGVSWAYLPAVWFRRRRGVTVACVGNLHAILRAPTPETAREAAERMTDGRYGGDCSARWGDNTFWNVPGMDWRAATKHMEFLRSMLNNYPAVPPGYDGWWRFGP